MQQLTLSEPALALLKRRLSGQWVEVTEETRPLYEELVDAGLMEPLNSFRSGPRGAYRLTEAAVTSRAIPLPCGEEAPAPRS